MRSASRLLNPAQPVSTTIDCTEVDTIRVAWPFETLMSNSGIARDSTVVIYGDNNNWLAAWAFWQMKIYGHSDVRLMKGGRKKCLAEGREVSTETPKPAATKYRASAARDGHIPGARSIPWGKAVSRKSPCARALPASSDRLCSAPSRSRPRLPPRALPWRLKAR